MTGFEQWADTHWSLDDFAILNNSLGCNCLQTSSVGVAVRPYCWPVSGQAVLPHSPIRDWWLDDL